MQIVKGKIEQAEMHIWYGPDGIGKTSALLSMPKPLIQDLDKGSGNLAKAERFPAITTWDEAQVQYEWFKASKDYQTLGIDSLDRLEALIINHVVKASGKKNLDDVGGYGKGYQLVMDEWLKFSHIIIGLRESGKNVILVGHSEVKTVNDPMTVPYDRYQLKLYHKAASLLRETVDNVFFFNSEVIAKEKEKRGFSDGLRYVFTERTPAWDAKNRFSLPMKFELPEENFFQKYKEAKGEGLKPEELKKIILEKASKLNTADQELVIARVEEAGKDVDRLLKIKTKVEAYA